MSIYNKIFYNDDNQRFECSNCPDICCKSFSIKVSEEAFSAISELQIVKDLLKSSNSSFEYYSNKQFYLPEKETNGIYKCLFHDDNKHCQIHCESGYKLKPPECQLYPFSIYFDKHNNVHLEASFKCKSILENYGKKIVDIKDYIACSYLNLEYYPSNYPLYNKILSQEEVFLLADKLRTILNNNEHTTDECVFNYFGFLNNFKERIKEDDSFDDSCIFSLSKQNKLLDYPNSKISKHIGCILLANLLLYKTYNRKLSCFKNAKEMISKYIYLYKSINKLSKKLALPFQVDYINLKKASEVNFLPDKDSESLIKRYLSSSVIRHKYLMLETTNLQFFNRVILYYCLIKTYSKISASVNQRNLTQFSDILNAVSTIEFVFYHTNITLTPAKFFSNTVNTFLHKSLSQHNVVYNLIYKPLS